MDRFTRFAIIAFTTIIFINFILFNIIESSLGLIAETVLAVLFGLLVAAVIDVQVKD